jgi:hypothetical protein
MWGMSFFKFGRTHKKKEEEVEIHSDTPFHGLSSPQLVFLSNVYIVDESCYVPFISHEMYAVPLTTPCNAPMYGYG